MAEIETWDGCIHQTLTEDDVKDIIPSTSQEIEVKNDYCSEDILFLLKNLNVINIFEAGYTYAKHPAITHQVVMKWLREQGIDIIILPVLKNEYNKQKYYIWQTTGRKDKVSTYEEAVEAALEYCLTELI